MRNSGETTQDYIRRTFDRIIDGLPAFLGALAVVIISYLVAKILEGTARRLLRKANLNDRLHAGQGGNVIQRAVPDPAHTISRVVFWVIYLFGLSIAVSVLGIPVLTDFVRAVYAYLPNVFAALLIFLVASGISASIVTLVNNTMGNTPTGKVVSAAGPVLVMSLAAFMILNQLKIAPAIVTITYAALVGSAALGMALAFGLGGREVAATMLQNLYDKSQQAKVTAKRDARVGVTNAKKKARSRLA